MIRRIRQIPLWPATLGFCVFVLACGSEQIAEPAAEARLLPASPNLLVGSTVKLDAFALSGSPLDAKPQTWSSSATDIVSVDAEGRITGKATGSAKIRIDVGDTFAETTVTVVGERSSLSAGPATACGIAKTGELYCWGDNSQGQAGTGNRETPLLSPRRAGGSLGFTSVSTGNTHGCGITGSGTYCWGDNTLGQLGDGTSRTSRLEPAPVSSPIPFVAISVNSTIIRTGIFECLELYVCMARSCALAADGSTYCWGSGILVPARLSFATKLRELDVSYESVCALDIANVPYCWGNSRFNESGPLTSGSEPPRVPGGLALQSISGGHGHSCGLAFDGDIYCWGANPTGELGASSGEEYCLPALGVRSACRAEPRKVETDYKFIVVSAGTGPTIRPTPPFSHTCAVATTLEVFCWGGNRGGQLGNGTTQPTQVPVPVSGNRRFRWVSAGASYTCGITIDDDAYCWGVGGRLGTGSTTGSLTPVPVAGGVKFR